MLRVKDLTLSAGSFQVNRVSFAVAEGSCHVLLGPTGSGKSLILESIAGLRHPRKGTIHLWEKEISGIFPEERKIAYLPQDLALFPTMSVKDNIAYSLRLRGLGKTERYFRIEALASSLGIDKLLDRNVSHLSGGEKQRVALARALSAGSKVMLLDEPLSSLHASLRREVWYLLQEIRHKHKLTYLIVTHDLEEALFLGDTISIISGGRLLQTGEKNIVFNRPGSLEAARITGVENFFAAVVKKVQNGHLLLHCPAISSYFKVEQSNNKDPFREGNSVTVGIRANNLVLAEHANMPEKTNSANFVVETVYEKGSSITVLLRSSANREILAVAEQNKLSLLVNPGQKVKVIFPGKHILVYFEK